MRLILGAWSASIAKSPRGWQRWVDHQTMLLNEYRLTPIDPKHRQFLVEEMQKFLIRGRGCAGRKGSFRPARHRWVDQTRKGGFCPDACSYSRNGPLKGSYEF
jgi:hypothetical protein